MTDTTHYKYLKLSSGDNIICKTEDDCTNIYDRKTIKVTHPTVLSAIRVPTSRGIVESYVMYPLFSFTNDEEYIIPTSQILLSIGITEKLKDNYLTYLSKQEDEETELVVNDDMEEDEEESLDDFLNRLGDEQNEETENRDSPFIGRIRGNTKRLH